MKTTTKLSVFAFLGLSFVAYYGQDYSGKVGINTDKPNATLEIKGKSDNTNNTLEGLVIPNVSINKTLQMGGNTSIKESTLIYVNDLSDYTTTPADAKVIDITEKGYYFWNGTKWVKTAGKEGQEWVYNPTNKRIELKRSGTPPFNNKVYYDENGVAYNGGHSEDDDVIFAITATDPVKGVITKYIPTPYKGTARGKVSMYDTLDNLPLNTFKHPITGASIYLKNQRSNFLSISSSDQYQPGVGVVGGRNQIDILEGNNNSYSSVLGSTFLANAIGGGTVSILDGIQSYGNVGNGQSAGTLRGGFLQASFDTSGNVDNLYGSQGTAFLKPAATGNVTNAVGGYFFSNIGSKGLNTNVYGTIGQVSVGKDSGNTTFVGERLVAGCFTVYNSGRTQYKTQSGVYAGSTVADPTVATAPINNYGVFVENISGGSNGNYAIYTNAGSSSLGDKLSLRNDKWAANQEAILEFQNGSSKKIIDSNNIETRIATSQIIDQMNGSGDGGSNLIFKTQSPTPGTNPNLTLPTEKMRIQANGNMGIGITTPSEKLEIAGAIKIGTTTSTCTSANYGAIKFESDNFYGCKSTGWVLLNN